MSNMMAAKRKNLSLSEKKALIESFEKSNLSKAAFAKLHGMPRTTVNNILSSKSSTDDLKNGKRKRQRISPFDKVEQALLIWIKSARTQNLPISSFILKEKALEIADELGESNFSASNGWLQRFTLRHDLVFKKVCGEAASVNGEELEEWRESKLSDVLKRYKPCDIYNADECGLFYRVLPEKTLSFKNEKCIGGKKSKERLSILFAANIDGSEKLTPLVIGKSLRPRCMKNVKSLPVIYDANPKSWMTSSIWEKTIQRLDRCFLKKKRKVAFIIDNCAAHCKVPGLNSIELVFLPPNSTSVSQPLDQGVIQNFKVNYRKLLIKGFISAIDKNEKFSVSVLDALFYIEKAWNNVSKKTISNCFRHARFCPSEKDVQSSDDEDEDEPLAELAQRLRNHGCAVPGIMEYATIDNDVATSAEASTANIVSEVINSNAAGSNDEESDDELEIRHVTQAEALNALNTVRCFFAQSEDSEEHYKTVSDLEKIVVRISKKKERQSYINEYFKS